MINNLGMVLYDLGDLPAARAAFERALAIDSQAFGPDHPKVASDVNNLGRVLTGLRATCPRPAPPSSAPWPSSSSAYRPGIRTSRSHVATWSPFGRRTADWQKRGSERRLLARCACLTVHDHDGVPVHE